MSLKIHLDESRGIPINNKANWFFLRMQFIDNGKWKRFFLINLELNRLDIINKNKTCQLSRDWNKKAMGIDRSQAHLHMAVRRCIPSTFLLYFCSNGLLSLLMELNKALWTTNHLHGVKPSFSRMIHWIFFSFLRLSSGERPSIRMPEFI